MSKYKIRFRLEAYVDLEDIETYYNEISLPLASMFFSEFSKTLNIVTIYRILHPKRYFKQ